ncbi:MAG: hypothetical protein JWM68_1914, partial [Verrucomicrobiales bacterium]|nr:hypothetical protein [Verrucomicrobiales bacterium]
ENKNCGAMGEYRTLLAEYFYQKADDYFVGGRRASIYDDPAVTAIAADNWIARFGFTFRSRIHIHLDEREDPGEIRQLLPWLRLAVEADPSHIDSYTLAAFVLTKGLRQPREAERFLREGLQANPGNCVLWFELGHLQFRQFHNSGQAQYYWRLAFQKLSKASNLSAEDAALLSKVRIYLVALAKESPQHTETVEPSKTFPEYLQLIKNLTTRVAALQKNAGITRSAQPLHFKFEEDVSSEKRSQ